MFFWVVHVTLSCKLPGGPDTSAAALPEAGAAAGCGCGCGCGCGGDLCGADVSDMLALSLPPSILHGHGPGVCPGLHFAFPLPVLQSPSMNVYVTTAGTLMRGGGNRKTAQYIKNMCTQTSSYVAPERVSTELSEVRISAKTDGVKR